MDIPSNVEAPTQAQDPRQKCTTEMRKLSIATGLEKRKPAMRQVAQPVCYPCLFSTFDCAGKSVLGIVYGA